VQGLTYTKSGEDTKRALLAKKLLAQRAANGTDGKSSAETKALLSSTAGVVDACFNPNCANGDMVKQFKKCAAYVFVARNHSPLRVIVH
jgi:hypothetical protein